MTLHNTKANTKENTKSNTKANKNPFVLIILDGFGLRDSDNANAIKLANTPHWDELWRDYPHTELQASGESVGLPKGQMGNSEVGHLTLGAGRIIQQDLSRIFSSIEDGSFFKNPVFIQALQSSIQPRETERKTEKEVEREASTIHIVGLLSPGGVHSHEDHIHALITLAHNLGVQKLIVHAIVDGRDTPPKSAMSSLEKLENLLNTFPNYRIGSICGRYYAMDRDKRYERTEKAYQLLTENVADYHAENSITALKMAYDRNETDEFVKPTLIGEKNPIQDNDVVIMMNFRSDRMRQLSYAFTDPNFIGFKRNNFPKLKSFVTLTQYAEDLEATVVFPNLIHQNLLGPIFANNQLKQLRIAETEKYAHVTYFFNGGRDEPFPNETRILIPSPKVATYDLCPEMSAIPLTDQIIDAILQKNYDVIICNFANADMLGHTGNLNATIQSIEVLDESLGRILKALQEVNGQAIITADHGNAECMKNEQTGEPHTAHTTELVPFVYFGSPGYKITDSGNDDDNDGNDDKAHTLADIAPTMLSLLGLPIPKEMTGQSLLKYSTKKK